MLKISILGGEYYNERSETFEYAPECELILEHSLSSLSEWESKWKKPFISKTPKTYEEVIDYIKCMTINKSDIDNSAYSYLTNNDIDSITKYMDDKMTATTIKDTGPPSRRIVTSEVIYSWMVGLNIPFECQYWHLNRLLTLIRVCNIEQQPPKKMTKAQTMRQNSALNKARKAKRR